MTNKAKLTKVERSSLQTKIQKNYKLYHTLCDESNQIFANLIEKLDEDICVEGDIKVLYDSLDISDSYTVKLERIKKNGILQVYDSEIGTFSFPFKDLGLRDKLYILETITLIYLNHEKTKNSINVFKSL